MTIYVDSPRDYGKKGIWAHMMTDGDLKELHQFARSIGLSRSWFQKKSWPHYDLRLSKREKAISLGAVAVTSKELVQRCVLRKMTP